MFPVSKDCSGACISYIHGINPPPPTISASSTASGMMRTPYKVIINRNWVLQEPRLHRETGQEDSQVRAPTDCPPTTLGGGRICLHPRWSCGTTLLSTTISDLSSARLVLLQGSLRAGGWNCASTYLTFYSYSSYPVLLIRRSSAQQFRMKLILPEKGGGDLNRKILMWRPK